MPFAPDKQQLPADTGVAVHDSRTVARSGRDSLPTAGKKRAGFFKDFLGSLQEPEFWGYSSWLDIVTRYRRMHFGALWLFLPAIAYVLGLGIVYSRMMGTSAKFFVPHLGLGYILWRFTIQAVQDSASAYVSHKAFIMDGRTRFTDFILRAFGKSLFSFFFAFLVVLAVLLVDPIISNVRILTLLVTLPFYIVNILWLCVVVSLVGARYPDTKEIINTTLIFGFLLTPIIWEASRVPAGTLRGTLMRLNPAFHFIEFVRAPVMGGWPEATSIQVVVWMTVFGWAAAAWLYNRYARFVPLWI